MVNALSKINVFASAFNAEFLPASGELFQGRFRKRCHPKLNASRAKVKLSGECPPREIIIGMNFYGFLLTMVGEILGSVSTRRNHSW